MAICVNSQEALKAIEVALKPINSKSVSAYKKELNEARDNIRHMSRMGFWT